jgi:hypothetical protein
MRDYSEICNEIIAKYACNHPKKERRNEPDRNGRPKAKLDWSLDSAAAVW